MFSLIPWKRRSGDVAVRHGDLWREDDIFYPLARMREELDALMDRFFGESWPAWDLWEGLRPRWAADFGLEDRGEEYVFHAELPGFEPEDFDVKVRGNVVTVRATHEEEKKGKNGSYRYGSFYRSFTLPYGVDSEHIEARYHNGVLELHLPKTEEARGKRIEVKTG